MGPGFSQRRPPHHQAEQSGLFSTLESSGAFSTIEKLLPIGATPGGARGRRPQSATANVWLPVGLGCAADKVGLLSLTETLVNVPAAVLFLAGVGVLGGEAFIITQVPDDTTALLVAQAVSAVLAGGIGVTLVGLAYVVSIVQGDN